MIPCEICSADSENGICPDCQYLMQSGDSYDIWKRVQDHDNSEYEIEQIKIDICKHFGVDPDYIVFDRCRGHAYSKARHLFIYVLFHRFNIKKANISKMMKFAPTQINFILNTYGRKFNSNLAVEKMLFLLKY